MTPSLDEDLARLQAGATIGLDGVENAVWGRIRADGDNVFRHPLQVQVALTCAAMLVGVAVAQFVGAEPTMRSEVAISTDSLMSPAILLAGDL